MVKLNCTARNCVNNEGGLCGANYILIQGPESASTKETYCSNFKEDSVLNEISAVTNTNFVGEIMQIISSNSEIKMSPMISCYARRCFYNENGKCGARNISIVAEGATNKIDTSCETFIE